MSKKSRKRNKKILAILGLAAAATAASRRNKGAVSTANQPVGVDRRSTSAPPIGGTDHISKVVVPKAKAIVDTPPKTTSNYLSRMTGHGTQSGDVGQKIRAGQSDIVRGVLPPSQLLAPQRIHKRGVAGNVNYRKDGGRATYKAGGIAKRGVSPILLKGKK